MQYVCVYISYICLGMYLKNKTAFSQIWENEILHQALLGRKKKKAGTQLVL